MLACVCRYAIKSYKKHYACFACRKAFKRRNKAEVDALGDDHLARCPDCAGPMADMGLDFKAPKKTDAKAWRAAEALFAVGETFHSCGCGGPGYRPRDPAKLAAFFAKRATEYRAQLASWVRAKPTTPALVRNRESAIAAWSARIAKLEAAHAKVTMGRASRSR